MSKDVPSPGLIELSFFGELIFVLIMLENFSS